jgi:hypothetical protein
VIAALAAAPIDVKSHPVGHTVIVAAWAGSVPNGISANTSANAEMTETRP